MRILIIGSNGFIGKHCVEYFKNKKYNVFEADIIDYQKKNYTYLDKENTNFEQLFINKQYDICINASGSANVAFSFNNSFLDFNLNVINVSKLLDLIYKYNKECKFINISSAAVYGNPQYLPIDENHELNPISPYGFHKLQSEQLLKEYSQLFNLKTISLRIFSAYGEGLKKQLFWDLFNKSKNSSDFELFGTGNETRDFIYIKDLLNVIELIIKKAEFDGKKINIANGKEVKIKDAVDVFLKISKSESKYVFCGKNKIGDPVNWKADISQIKKIGYKQKYNLTEGLTEYIEWLKELK